MEQAADRAGPDEVDTALDRLLLGEALAQLSEDHRAVIRRAYYQGWTTAQIAADLRHRRGHGEVPAALRGPGAAAQAAGNGGDTMTQFGLPRGGDAVDDDRYVTWDAAYVLGSLSSAERREYEAHLETCPRCRTAVAELSGIPALARQARRRGRRALDDGQSRSHRHCGRRCWIAAGQRARAPQALAVGDHRRGRRGGRRCWPSVW